jgi:hypothetical protein
MVFEYHLVFLNSGWLKPAFVIMVGVTGRLLTGYLVAQIHPVLSKVVLA